MATTYTWAVAQLERTTADGIVYTVHYTVNANDGTYEKGAYGSIGLESPAEGDTVIPFADLTKATCVQWVKDKLNEGDSNVAAIEAALQDQLDEMTSPTKASGVPDGWNAAE